MQQRHHETTFEIYELRGSAHGTDRYRDEFKRWATKSNIKKQKERPKVKTQMTSPSKKPPTTQKKKNRQTVDKQPSSGSSSDPYRIIR